MIAIATVLGQTLASMGMKLMAKEFMDDFILFVLQKAVKLTESKADDELVEMVSKHLKG
jgi:hypothetical protein